MIVSAAGRKFLERNEGCALTAYWDVDGYSIGYGHHGKDVHEGMQITRQQADSLLSVDLVWYAAQVDHLVTVDVSQAQFDALVDFAYNEGINALRGSTLLRILNAGGSLDDVADQFLVWEKVLRDGRLVDDKALLVRRQAERSMFLGLTP